MTDHTGNVTIDNPEQASTNFYWTYEYMTPNGQSQVFNFQTTFRGVLDLEQMKAHIKMALEGTAHIAELGGQAKQIGKAAYETPASTIPKATPVDQIITEQANMPFPTEEPAQKPSGNTFMTKHLEVTIKDGKKSYKIKGEPPYHLYGVTVYDEVLVKAGIPTGKLEGKPYVLEGYKATISVNDKGYKKVSSLEKI